MDLVGAIREARPAGLSGHLGERRVVRIAERPVHLNRAIDHPVKGIRHKVLRHGNFALEVFATINAIGRVQNHELTLIDLHGGVGDHPLDALLLT